MIGFSKATVKSVQRGVYAGAGGTVTISAVDTTKAVVMSKSKSSSGYVAATGSAAGSVYPCVPNEWGNCACGWCPVAGCIWGYRSSAGTTSPSTYHPDYKGSLALSGGSTCLTAKQFSAVLTNATTITCDGPVEWQVIEYF